MATITPPSKHNATLTGFVRHGKNPIISDMQAFTFNTVVVQDGTQLKDVTFNQLADAVWSIVSKHNATLTAPAKH